MSVVPEPGSLGSRQTLFSHALSLHHRSPESPLPGKGEPYPDDEHHHEPSPAPPHDSTLIGVDAAGVLREHFADPAASPGDLVAAFHDIFVPVFHYNEHIADAARAADPVRVRETGRWLVRHSTDRCSAIIGLTLIAAVGTVDDTALIQTIGLLSDEFGPLAARALERLEGGTSALIWLADRVAGSSRVDLVQAIVRLADPVARPWLLRRAVEGGPLDGRFAGEVAKISALHEVVIDPSADDDVVDHAGRLLHVLTHSQSSCTSIENYPYAAVVMDVHIRRIGTQQPTVRRFVSAARIASYLSRGVAATYLGWPPEQVIQRRDAYLSVLNRDDWCAAIRRAVEDGDEHVHPQNLYWLNTPAGRSMGLRAFAGPTEK